MKNILLTLLLLSPLAFADMKPLKEYLASIDELGASEVLYANYRCLGLFGMVLNVTGGSTQENSMNINAIVDANSKILMEQTYSVWASVRKDKSTEAFLENIKVSIPPIADNYQELANENWENTGTYFEGNDLIIGDIQICNELVSMFQQEED